MGNVGPIGAILLFIFFLINWFIWLGAKVNQIGLDMVTSNNLTGVEAFFYTNLNFTILICMVLGLLGYTYFGAMNAQ
jgi:hypothetical protein